MQRGRLLIRWSLVRFQPGEPMHYISLCYKVFIISFRDKILSHRSKSYVPARPRSRPALDGAGLHSGRPRRELVSEIELGRLSPAPTWFLFIRGARLVSRRASINSHLAIRRCEASGLGRK